MKLHLIPKESLVEEALKLLGQALEELQHQARTTAEGATHAESRPENSKDTRGLEASYLARGLATRVAQLEADLTQLRRMPLKGFGPEDPISASALVRLHSPDSGDLVLFLTPCGGGTSLRWDLLTIVLVTPRSPLGKAVLGKQLDDALSLKLDGKEREYELIEVA